MRDESSAERGPDFPPKRRAASRLLRSALPWIAAAAIIAYVFSRVPFADALDVVRSARPELFIPLVLGSVLVWFAIDAGLYAYLFSRFNQPVPFREARALRGMSYLLTPIHWNVGKAAVILRLKQRRGIPLLESTSTVMLYQSVDGFILAILASLGLGLLASESAGLASARATTGIIATIILLSLVLVRIPWPRLAWLDWWRGLTIHHAHRQLRIVDLVVMLVLKGAYHLGFVIAFYFGLESFGVSLPFALVLAATPIIQAVGALPITPAGLGTQQAAMLYFFSGRFGSKADEAAIVAFGFSFPIALILARLLIGLFYLGDLAQSDPKRQIPVEAPLKAKVGA